MSRRIRGSRGAKYVPWALGISDTLALGLITEAIGLELPIVALPYLNNAQAAHPALAGSVRLLREWGVTVPLGDGGFEPHPPKRGRLDEYPWDTALDALPGQNLDRGVH